MSYAAALRRRATMDRSRLVLPALFLILAVPVMLISAVLVPTGEVPDEVAHIVRANGLLHRSILGYRVPTTDSAGNPAEDAGVTANAAMITAGFAFPPGVPKSLTRDRLQDLYATPWADAASFISIPNTAVYSPAFYVPAAIALGAAHLAGFGPYKAILIARLCNALCFTALGLAALLLTHRAQGVLFATLALPMSIALGASCNQDGLVIATACLTAALLTRPELGAWWTGVLALALVIAAKPVYLPLAGLPALGLPRRRLELGLRAAGLLVAALPAIAWFAVAQRFVAVPFVRGEPYPAGPLWPGPSGQMFAATNTHEQLRVFLHDPALLFTLPLDALRDGYNLLLGLVGILGTLDLLLPPWLYTVWFLALAAIGVGALFGSEREWPGWPFWASLLGLLCIAATVIAIADGQYLSWTLVGASAIDGLQGRYGVPLIPMLGLIWPRLRLPGGAALRTLLEIPAVLAAAAGLVTTPLLLVLAYYLR